MKIKLLSILLLSSFMGAINAAESAQLAIPGKQAFHRQAEGIERLEDLKPMLKEITESLLLENDELKKQLGQKAVSFIVTPYFIPPSLDQDGSLTGVQFVQTIYADFSKWIVATISELEQENSLLKEQLGRIKERQEAHTEDKSEEGAFPQIMHRNFPFSGEYDIGITYPEIFSDHTRYSGAVNLKSVDESLVQLSGFRLIEGSYYHKQVTETLHDNPGTDFRSLLFGENEISRFILDEMPKMTFDLKLFQGSSFQYGQGVKFNSRDIFVRLTAEAEEPHLILMVEYPNGYSGTSPLQQFILVRDIR